MAKSKWPQVQEKLILVEAWARDGATDDIIAKKLGISESTLNKYKLEHPEFSESLKKGKEVVDVEVENALLKRAKGYEYQEQTFERVWNEKLQRYIKVNTKTVTKQVVPDTTAEMFWLQNRRPDKWRNVQKIEHSGNVEVNNPFSGLTTEELRKMIKDD